MCSLLYVIYFFLFFWMYKNTIEFISFIFNYLEFFNLEIFYFVFNALGPTIIHSKAFLNYNEHIFNFFLLIHTLLYILFYILFKNNKNKNIHISNIEQFDFNYKSDSFIKAMLFISFIIFVIFIFYLIYLKI